MPTTLPQNKTPLRRPVQQIPQQQEEKKERIKTWVAAAMIATALVIDIITLLPAIGSVISIAAYFGFFVWFKINGVTFTKNFKNIGVFGISAIIEFFLSFLPSLTAGVTGLILMTRAEDRGGMLGKAASLAQGKIAT